MMAKLTDKPPEGEQWTYEVKWDGYRALLVKDHGHVQLRSRNDNNLTSTYPTIHAAALKLKAETALLDGEIVALDPNGKPAFHALQHRAAHRNYAIVFYRSTCSTSMEGNRSTTDLLPPYASPPNTSSSAH